MKNITFMNNFTGGQGGKGILQGGELPPLATPLVVQSISHTKSGCFSICFIDSVTFYFFPILSHVFRYFLIISSSVLEQAGFSEIQGVISSNPTWQCLSLVYCFFASI